MEYFAELCRKHGCAVHTTRVYGPCWEKALHDNAFSPHGPCSRVRSH